MNQHTPLPWSQYQLGTTIYGADGFYVGITQSKNPEADAALIVTAVNSYASSQAEIARLRNALETIIREDDTGPERYEISDRTYPPAQALGGSEGKFAAAARAALSVQP